MTIAVPLVLMESQIPENNNSIFMNKYQFGNWPYVQYLFMYVNILSSFSNAKQINETTEPRQLWKLDAFVRRERCTTTVRASLISVYSFLCSDLYGWGSKAQTRGQVLNNKTEKCQISSSQKIYMETETRFAASLKSDGFQSLAESTLFGAFKCSLAPVGVILSTLWRCWTYCWRWSSREVVCFQHKHLVLFGTF